MPSKGPLGSLTNCKTHHHQLELTDWVGTRQQQLPNYLNLRAVLSLLFLLLFCLLSQRAPPSRGG